MSVLLQIWPVTEALGELQLEATHDTSATSPAAVHVSPHTHIGVHQYPAEVFT